MAFSHREFEVLRLRPFEMICYKCLAKLAPALPAESEVPPDFLNMIQFGAGSCSVCAQFSTIARFVSPAEPEQPETKAVSQG
jgi:hypothetical protein